MSRLPTQLGLGPRRVGIGLSNVASASVDDLVGEVVTDRPLERVDHLEDGRAVTRAEVPRVDGGISRSEAVQGGDVPGCEVLDMDVVAHSRAVRRRVVAAIDGQLLAPTHRDLGDEGHEVVGNAARVLADRAARMRTHRVEVAQQGHPPGRVGSRDIAQNLLDHHLGPAIGVGRRRRRILLHRHLRVVAIDRRRAREDELVHVVAAHRPHEGEGGDEVVLVVLERFGHTLTDGLEAREVDDRIDLLLRKQVLGLVVVGEVERTHVQRHTGQCFEATHHRRLGVGEGVDDDHVVPCRDELKDGVRADVAGTTRDENAHDTTLLPGSTPCGVVPAQSVGVNSGNR